MEGVVFSLIIAILLYPGLLTALASGLLYRVVLRGGLQLPPSVGASLRTREGLALAAGLLQAGLGLASLPWPLHPLPTMAATDWLLTWAAFELAFLLPLLPALFSTLPAIVRAALREAQLGVLARALAWSALGTALVLHDRWEGLALLAHLLALGAALVALPAALGWGPFSAETQITPGGVTAGLPAHLCAFDEFGRDLRAAIFLVALLVAGLPLGILPPWLGLLLVAGGVVLGAALLRNFDHRLPRLTLPDALRFCLLWCAPLSLAAAITLAILGPGR